MEELKKEGWHINETLAEEFFDDNGVPKRAGQILDVLLHEDMREFGDACIINLHKKDEGVMGSCVLQLLRYRNIGVPRIREEFGQADQSNAIVRLFLTDGHTSLSAILLEPIPGITSETPPGTKIHLLQNVTVEGNFMLLHKDNTRVIGGKVEKLIEKWKVEKSSIRAEGFKQKGATGAPKWVSFGKRGAQKKELDKNFKANDAIQTVKKDEDNENDFAKNREQTIKELDQQVKVFAKPNLAPPPPTEPKPPPPPKAPKEEKPRKAFKKRGRKNSEDGDDIDVGEYANVKPSGPATLFDFMTDVVDTKQLENKMGNLKVEEQRKYDNPRSTGRNVPSGAPRGQNFRGKDSHGGGRGGHQTSDRRSVPAPRGGDNFDKRNQQGSQSDRRPFNSSSGAPREQKGYQKEGGHQSLRGPQHQGGSSRGGNYEQRGGQNAGVSNQKFSAKNNDASNPRQGGNYQNQRFVASNNDAPNPRQSGGYQNQGFSARNNDAPNPRQGGYQNQGFGAPRNTNPGSSRAPNQGGYQHNQQQFQPRNQDSRQTRQGVPPLMPPKGPQWRVGAKCLAPWHDGSIYPAVVVEIYPNNHCAVKYDNYDSVNSLPMEFLIMP